MRIKFQKELSYWFSVAVVGIVVGLALQFAKAWKEPQGNPPQGNLGAPINTGGEAQIKDGPLTVDYNRWLSKGYTSANLTNEPGLVVGGKAQATDFCLNANKNKCLSNVTTGLKGIDYSQRYESSLPWDEMGRTGNSFSCPAGYVMTGVIWREGSGFGSYRDEDSGDNIQIVCHKLY